MSCLASKDRIQRLLYELQLHATIEFGMWLGVLVTLVLGQVSRDDRHEAVARHFAPLYFHQEAAQFEDTRTGFNSVDTPVDLFFDGNEDLTDNAKNIFELDYNLSLRLPYEVPLYYSITETRSHFYLNYFFYHGVDTFGYGHPHDTENALLIIEKDGSFWGKLEVLILNAHGYPMIYSSSFDRENEWRSRLHPSLAWRLVPRVDSEGARHHKTGRLEILSDGESESPAIFVSAQSHALYKFSHQVWSGGTVYSEMSHRSDLVGMNQRRYRLVLFDEVFYRMKDRLQFEKESKFFAVEAGSFRHSALSILASPIKESRVSLFFRTKFRTPHALSDPASFHLYFEPENKNISRSYLYNPYEEILSIQKP